MTSINSLKFSIITVVYNGEAFIEETIKSVLNQTYANVEYIIIDGASSDQTVNIINQYSDQLHYFISEKDSGMYDAINKGIAKATGDYILILNSDDYLFSSHTLENISTNIKLKNLDFFYCNIVRKIEERFRHIKLRKYSFEEVLCSEHCTFVPHPSFFISRAFIEKNILTYNLQYKYASDFDYILKALKHSTNNYKHLNIISTVFRDHPNSITSSGKIDEERILILNEWGLNQISFIKRNYYYYKNWILYKLKSSAYLR